MKKNNMPTSALVCIAMALAFGQTFARPSLEDGFSRPPADARPQTWYHLMNGNVTKEGLTYDLEEIAKAGLGGVHMFDAGCDVPPGSLRFNTPEWFDFLRHAQKETKRLGLELCIPNCSGWSSSGGPWNMPSNGMKFVVFSETPAKGPSRFSGALPRTNDDHGFYEDIAVLAFPTPRPGAAISHLDLKTFRDRDWRVKVGRDSAPCAPEQAVAKSSVKDLTALLQPDGAIAWDVPEGDWTILRVGYANNGRVNHPASAGGAGPEVDKLAAWAMDWHFDKYVARLCDELGVTGQSRAKTGLTGILVDSYEVGGQNWTQGLEGIFRKRIGYDLTPYLPVFAGRVVGSVDETERFLEDFRRVVGDLFSENYSGRLAELCHKRGLQLYLEPYGNCPADNLDYGASADVPMGEFWAYASRGPNRSGETGNARFASFLSHVWGRRYAATESFTSGPDGGGRWQTTPYVIKRQGDRVFAEGVNRIIYHRFAHQPWPGSKYLPGITMGRWGMHLDRTQTWWKHAPAWFLYQSRCSWMLQEGKPVSDALFWCGEWMPNAGGDDYTGGSSHFGPERVGLPAGYHWDVCSTKAFMALTVKNGKVVSPGGAEYPLLVLPKAETMSEAALRKIANLIDAGAKVCSETRPSRSEGLRGWPAADAKIAALAEKVWARGVMECSAAEALQRLGIAPDFTSTENDAEFGAVSIHRRSADADWYFTALGNDQPRKFEASYRISGRTPEIWDPVSGARRPAPVWREESGRTVVTLDFPPSGSAFVVFRKKAASPHVVSAKAGVSAREEPAGNQPPPDWEWTGPGRIVFWQPGEVSAKTSDGATLSASANPPVPVEVQGAWDVAFPAGWDAPASVVFPRLIAWNEHEDKGVKYFSGTATYSKRIPAEAVAKLLAASDRVMLDLGAVRDFAEVAVNGKAYPVLWKPPFRVDITDAVKDGKGLDLRVKVTNLWPNRLIGDDFLPEDCAWRGKREGGINEIGLAEFPEWVRKGEKSPFGRHTFTTWKHWTKDDALLPSGLLGPVLLRGGKCADLADPNGYADRLVIGSSQFDVTMPSGGEVLKSVRISLAPASVSRAPSELKMRASDSAGSVYQSSSASLADGHYVFTLVPGGRTGRHRIEFADGRATGSVSFDVAKVDTSLTSNDDPRIGPFFDDMKHIILKEIRHIPFDGKVYYENKEWLRDHIHILKATRYWNLTETPPVLDPRTPLEMWIRLQFPDGIYPEIVVSAADSHVTYTRPEYATPMDGGRMMIRLEAENDIEFLMAQAIWQAWNATGDDAWLLTPLKGALSPLASIDKALQHVIDDKVRRWDDKLGLSVRGVSCDTWDWVYGQKGKDGNRRIEPETPLAVFYGDNTGLYQAFRQVAEMQRRVAKNEQRARYWEKKAADLKAALMKHAWNGRYFAHMVHTRPTVEQAPEEWKADFAEDWTRRSLSNAYSLNRGIFAQREAESVIESFLELRMKPPKAENADCPLAYEWVTLFPSYRNTAAILYEPGRYANGALGSFTAGELMRGAYVYGYEGYGSDILKRLLDLQTRDGEIVFMYDQNGQVFEKKPDGYDKSALSMGGGGPAGWGTAAIYDAMVAGLAGVRDIDGQFSKLTFSPAWESLGSRQARASVTFATTDSYFAYVYSHSPDKRRMAFRVASDKACAVKASIPVPPGAKPAQVLVNGKPVRFAVRTVSSHFDFDAASRSRSSARRSYADFTLKLRQDASRLDQITVVYK